MGGLRARSRLRFGPLRTNTVLTRRQRTQGGVPEPAAGDGCGRLSAMEAVGGVGSGIMGAGIAEVAARSGCDVLIREVTAELAEKGRSRIAASLERAVSRGTLSEADRDATLARVRTTTSLPDLADRDLVIEAIVEDEPTKTALYRELSGLVRPDCLLASNTSSIPISRLAAASEHPERVL